MQTNIKKDDRKRRQINLQGLKNREKRPIFEKATTHEGAMFLYEEKKNKMLTNSRTPTLNTVNTTLTRIIARHHNFLSSNPSPLSRFNLAYSHVFYQRYNNIIF